LVVDPTGIVRLDKEIRKNVDALLEIANGTGLLGSLLRADLDKRFSAKAEPAETSTKKTRRAVHTMRIIVALVYAAAVS